MVYLLVAVVILILILGSINALGYYMSSPRYKGPVTDHFDGKNFFTPGASQKSNFDAFRWMLTRRRGAWRPWVNSKPGQKPAERISDKNICITFINHATVLIQVDGINILTDPVWSERVSPFTFIGPKRQRIPGLMLEDLPPIDYVLLTHNHYDHLDIPTLNALAATHDFKIITTLGNSAFLKSKKFQNESTDMDWWETRSITDSIKITCTPAQHFSARGTYDKNGTLWAGFMVQSLAGNIYFAGDTAYTDYFKELKERFSNIHISILPIGAYLPSWFMSAVHMSPEEAVKAHLDLNSMISIPIHYGTFPLADESDSQALSDLKFAMDRYKVSDKSFVILKEGEGKVFSFLTHPANS